MTSKLSKHIEMRLFASVDNPTEPIGDWLEAVKLLSCSSTTLTAEDESFYQFMTACFLLLGKWDVLPNGMTLNSWWSDSILLNQFKSGGLAIGTKQFSLTTKFRNVYIHINLETTVRKSDIRPTDILSSLNRHFAREDLVISHLACVAQHLGRKIVKHRNGELTLESAD